MTDFYRSRRPSPWPRRIMIAVVIALAALLLYLFSATAAPLPPRQTMKPWPPAYPSRYYCQPGNPRLPAWCLRYGR